MADDDPAGQASAKLGQHLALAAALAQAVAQLRTLRAAERDRTDRHAAATARAELRARHTTDRLRWTPALNPTTRNQLDLDATAAAWTAARAWPGDPEADAPPTSPKAGWELQPDAMRIYDQAVASGADSLEAMRKNQVASTDQLEANPTGRPSALRPAKAGSLSSPTASEQPAPVPPPVTIRALPRSAGRQRAPPPPQSRPGAFSTAKFSPPAPPPASRRRATPTRGPTWLRSQPQPQPGLPRRIRAS